MFKVYLQNQIQLLPPDISEELGSDHLVKLISSAIDQMDLAYLKEKYSELGQNAYHPKMLLSILVYGYAIGLRSSRKITNACRENLAFMYLSGRQYPDFRTISDFRKDKLQDLKKIFLEVLNICKKLGMVHCGKVCLDGTKILASSNKHKATYRKTLEQRRKNLEEQIEEIFTEAELVDQEEDRLYKDADGIHTGIDVQDVQKIIAKEIKKLNKKKKTLKKKQQKKKEQLQNTTEKLQRMTESRNSYGNTDPDSTVMLMKEDYIAPGYNVQLATEKQVIIAYDLLSNRTDYHALAPMLKEIKINMQALEMKQKKQQPRVLIADAGYGNKANYQILDQQKQRYVIPYQAWNNDHGKRKRKEYTSCNKDPSWEQKKWQIYSHLNKDKNKKLLKLRSQDVEPVIGDIKDNIGMRRFLVRGKEKVKTEIGLAAIAHNFKKIKSNIGYWQKEMIKILIKQILLLS